MFLIKNDFAKSHFFCHYNKCYLIYSLQRGRVLRMKLKKRKKKGKKSLKKC